ncbi:MAG: InlB B-repeat-containing protein [Phocaeicola sp.]
MVRSFKLVYFLMSLFTALMVFNSCSKDEDPIISVKEYIITFEAGKNGLVTFGGEQIGIEGSVVESVATPNDGYTFTGWYNGDDQLTTEGDITVNSDKLKVKLTSATKGNTYTAKFQPTEYTITIEADENGGVTFGGEQIGIEGSVVESVATPNDGYTFTGWYNGDDQLTTEGDITVDSDTLRVKLTSATKGNTYTAKFQPTEYTITFEAGENGEITFGGEQTRIEGSVVESVATPSDDYTFTGWYYGDDPLTTGGDITVNSDTLKVKFTSATNGKTYTAKFQPTEYTITIEADKNGEVIPGGKQTGVKGTFVESVAKPIDDYTFTGWYYGDDPLTTGGDITVNSDTLKVNFTSDTNGKTYTAKFMAKEYRVTFVAMIDGVESTDGGTVSPMSADGVSGTTFSSTASVKRGYIFDGWYLKNEQISTSTTLNITSSSSVNGNVYEARFAIGRYTVTFEAGSNINGAQGTTTNSGSYIYGTEVQSIATATGENLFVGWYDRDTKITASSGDVYVSDNVLTVKVSSDKTYTAKFVGDGGGRVFVSGTGEEAKLELTNDPEIPGVFFQFGSVLAWSGTGNPVTVAWSVGTSPASWNSSWSVGSTFPAQTKDNILADKGDPCKLVGYTRDEINNGSVDNKQWRLPSRAEMEVFASRSIWGVSSGVSGRYFGRLGTTIEGEFLPALGYRVCVSGSLFDVSTDGYFWSSATINSNNGHSLGFYEKNVRSDGSNNQANGLSVRCVPQ